MTAKEMNRLERLKELNAKRDRKVFDYYGAELCNEIINAFDDLMAVIEAARHQVNGTWLHFCGPGNENCNCEFRDLSKALDKFQKETERGDGE